MTRNKIGYFDSPIVSFLIFFFSFKIMLSFSRLGFDPKHDGAVLAPAIAVKMGQTLFNDVFGLYGPLATWIQSFSLFLPLEPALALRHLNSFLIALTIFFMLEIGRIAPKNWNLSFSISLLAVFVWLINSEVLFGLIMLPWSSTIAGLFAAMGIFLIAKTESCFDREEKIKAKFFVFISGIIFGLTPFIKINIGLALLFSFVVYIAFCYLMNIQQKNIVFAYGLLGVFTSVLSIVLVLIFQNSIDGYIQQNILFPLNETEKYVSGWKTKENLIRMFTDHIFVVLIIFFSPKFINFFLKKNNKVFFQPIAFVFLGFLILIYELYVSINFFQIRNPDLGINFSSLSPYINETLLSFLLILVTVSCTYLLLSNLRLFLKKKNDFSNSPFAFLLAGTSFSLLVQIIPTWDPRHVWWGLPIGLLIAFSILKKIETQDKKIFFLFLPILIFMASLATISGYDNIKKHRVLVPEGNVATGLYVSEEQLLVLLDDSNFIKNNVGLNNKAIYMVWAGHLSVINGNFQSYDKYFTVPEISGISLNKRLIEKVPVIVEDSIFNEQLHHELFLSGYFICDRTLNSHLRVYKPQCRENMK